MLDRLRLKFAEIERALEAQRAQRAQTEQSCGLQEGTKEAHRGTKQAHEPMATASERNLCPDVPNVCPVPNRANTGFVPNVPNVPPTSRDESPNPWLTARQFSEAHAMTWTDSQIKTYLDRYRHARNVGVPAVAAEYWAELAMWRDIAADDRRACIECHRYRHNREMTWGVCGLPFDTASMATGKQEFFRLRRCASYIGRKLHD